MDWEEKRGRLKEREFGDIDGGRGNEGKKENEGRGMGERMKER